MVDEHEADGTVHSRQGIDTTGPTSSPPLHRKGRRQKAAWTQDSALQTTEPQRAGAGGSTKTTTQGSTKTFFTATNKNGSSTSPSTSTRTSRQQTRSHGNSHANASGGSKDSASGTVYSGAYVAGHVDETYAGGWDDDTDHATTTSAVTLGPEFSGFDSEPSTPARSPEPRVFSDKDGAGTAATRPSTAAGPAQVFFSVNTTTTSPHANGEAEDMGGGGDGVGDHAVSTVSSEGDDDDVLPPSQDHHVSGEHVEDGSVLEFDRPGGQSNMHQGVPNPLFNVG